jgi:lipoprotein-releasing system ATP-binding protein
LGFPPQAVLRASDIAKTFEAGPERLEVLRGVTLEVMTGEIVAILGPSGSGKSTLLHILAGLDRPTQGDVVLNGATLAGLSQSELAAFRNQYVGLVFQFHHLLPEFNVLENVMMPCLIAGESRASARQKAQATLEEIGFTQRMRHRPAELSGGEKQKVATARALVTNPRIVMADEPTGNLDFHSAQTLLNLFRELNSRKQVTMLVVSHNERVAAMADRRLYLTDGRLSGEAAAKG